MATKRLHDVTQELAALADGDLLYVEKIADTSDGKLPYANFKALINALIAAGTIGLLDDRGNYNASVNTFPATGGSGTAGAILKGDIWLVSVAGTLGGHTVNAGDTIRALLDTPGQTDANWAILEGNLGYTPENAANKSTDVALGASNTFYSSQGAVKSYVDTKWATPKTSTTKSASYAGLDNDGFSLLRFTGSATYTIPLAANNVDREIELVNAITAGGLVTFTPQGANKLVYMDTQMTLSMYLWNLGGRAIIRSDGTNWHIVKLNTQYIGGWFYISDERNKHLGFAICPYDGEQGTPAVPGESFVEETSGITGILFFRDATNMYFYNVSSPGFFTNNKKITFSGDAARYVLVNTATTTKGIDSNIYHGLGISRRLLPKIKAFLNTSASLDGAFEFLNMMDNNSVASSAQNNVDVNNLRIQTGTNGLFYTAENGASTLAATSNLYLYIAQDFII
jgi:hypothetical protein